MISFLNKEKNNTVDINKNLIAYAKMDDFYLLKELNVDLKTGLDPDYVEEYQENNGFNEITTEGHIKWYNRLFNALFNPFSIVLMILSCVSLITKDYIAGAVILTMVLMGSIIKYIQEEKSCKASEKLKALIKTTATVLRLGKRQEILINELVVGDIIFLAAGDIIPADVRIIKAKDLFLSQANLTGESEPIEKFSKLGEKTLKESSNSPLDYEDLCFMGTNVISGSATAVVVAIGGNTCFGNVAKSVMSKKIETDFDKGLKSISYLLIKFMIIMVLIVFSINGILKQNWLEAFLFSISIAVGLTPEMLPMIITTNLAKGALNMSRKKTIVKNLNSIQNFGAMDILCTDKTGTLTEDRIVLQYHLNINGEEDKRVLKHAYLNSQFQTGLKNLLDLAIIQKGVEKGFFELNGIYTKIDEMPFDFIRKRMSVVLKDGQGKTQIITKGAVEEMLSICKFAEQDGEVKELTNEIKEKINEVVLNLNSSGMRVIALAQKNKNFAGEGFSVQDEDEMVLMGYLSFLDPAKQSAFSAIKGLKSSGVKVKVLTGDSDRVSSFVCKEVGIENLNIILGSEVEKLEDEELGIKCEQYDIFAKLTPQQKARIVKALKGRGHVVGFMGDGINDAPAMKQADVGISVDTAVDIAKESADIILLKKDLRVLQDGVMEGRKTFGNIIKYIKMTTSSNFGNMFSVLFASIFLPFLPMLPIQLLILNLLYDISQISIPWDNVDEEYLLKQKKWDANSIKKFMLSIGPVSSFFDIVTFLVLWYIFKCSDPSNLKRVELFHTGWFIASLVTQTSIIHLIRTEKIPFVESRASGIVIFSSILLILVGCFIPYSGISNYLGMIKLPYNFFFYLFFILISYICSVQIVKKIYIKKYNSWL